MKAPSVFPWLPVGFAVGGDFRVRRVLCEGAVDGAAAYQVVDAQADDNRKCALAKPGLCTPEAVRVLDDAGFAPIDFPGENIRAAVFTPDKSPAKVADIPLSIGPPSPEWLPDLARALAEIPGHCWGESLYIPALGRCIPFGKSESAAERRLLAIRILTGGIADPALSPKQICAVNKRIRSEDTENFFRTLNIPADPDKETRHPVRAPKEFVLPGQPELEAFFRERVIYYHRNRKKYESMGGKPVGAVLLYGPPGSGKTYSVKALADFLGWPMIEINIGGAGSPFIHQTSVQLKREFEKARKQAPAVVFLDEIDAMGGRRIAGHNKHEVEEITTLLTAIESVADSGVFTVAATNRKSALDPALLRSGRFGEHFEVPLPGPAALRAVLEHCLSSRKHAAGINLDTAAKRLAGCNFGDVERLVIDAVDFAVRTGKNEIDDECLKAAAEKIKPPRRKSRVGF